MLYVIGSDEFDPVKIGVTSNVFNRVTQLQAGNPFLLKVFLQVDHDRAFLLEKYIHQSLKEHNLRGEWFLISPDKQKTLKIIQHLVVQFEPSAPTPRRYGEWTVRGDRMARRKIKLGLTN